MFLNLEINMEIEENTMLLMTDKLYVYKTEQC